MDLVMLCRAYGRQVAESDTRTWRWRGQLSHSRVYRASSVQDYRRIVAPLRPTSLILDIEPWLVPWDQSWSVPPTEVDPNPLALSDSVQILLCTNSRGFFSRSVPVLEHSRKPWTSMRRIHARIELGERPVVVGDLLLTDGLLARRLRCPFIWMVPGSASSTWPRWPRFLHALGDVLAKPLLRPATPGPHDV